MTDKMARLKNLIEESNKIMDDVKAETKRLEAEHIANREKVYEAFISKMKEYAEVLGKYTNLKIDTGIAGNYGKENYFFVIRKGYNCNDVLVMNGKDCSLGCIEWEKTYEQNKYSQEHTSGLHYNIDNILDNFNYDVFEENMVTAVQEMISKNAEVTDANYQYAKSKLEADNK